MEVSGGGQDSCHKHNKRGNRGRAGFRAVRQWFSTVAESGHDHDHPYYKNDRHRLT